MYNFYIEHRDIELLHTTLSWDIAHHLYIRQFCGSTIIITDQPAILLSTVRKQWRKIERYVRREKSSTLQKVRFQELEKQLAHSERLRFAVSTAEVSPEKDVYFITPNQLEAALPPECRTVYATTQLTPSMYVALDVKLPPQSLLVTYTENGFSDNPNDVLKDNS